MTKQSNFTNGNTSNLSGIEKFFINLVKDGKLQQMPANYDCATLKMYISHLEKENAELKAQLKNNRLMTMADGTIKQLYSVEEVEHIVKERDELKARLEKAECNVGKAVFNVLKSDILMLMEDIDWLVGKITLAIEEYKAPLEALSWEQIIEQAEQRLAELKGGDKK